MKNTVSIVKINLVYNILFQIVIVVLGIFVQDIKYLLIISLIQYVLQIWGLKESFDKLMNFPTIFVTLSYVFTLSGLFVQEIFGYNSNENICILDKYGEKLVYDAVFFYVCAMLALSLGMYAWSAYHIIKLKLVVPIRFMEEDIGKVGIVLTVVGFIFKSQIEIESFMMRINGNYMDTYKVDVSGRAGLSLLYYSGMVMMLYCYGKDKLKARMVIVIGIFGEIINLLSGKRMYAVIFIITLMYVYSMHRVKVSMGRVILLLMIVYMGVGLLNTIREVRLNSFDLPHFFEVFLIQLKENPLFKILNEMGGSMESLLYSFKYIPHEADMGYGSCYIKTILSAFPIIRRFVNTSDVMYITLLPNSRYMGGHWLGELYYNFCYWGILILPLLGFLLKRIEQWANGTNVVLKLFALDLLFSNILYVRNYFFMFKNGIANFLVTMMVIVIIRIVRDNSHRIHWENSRKTVS